MFLSLLLLSAPLSRAEADASRCRFGIGLRAIERSASHREAMMLFAAAISEAAAWALSLPLFSRAWI